MFFAEPFLCPGSHPYPYSDGASCCAFPEQSNGLLMVYSATDCKNNDYINCPYTNCENNNCRCSTIYLFDSYFVTEITLWLLVLWEDLKNIKSKIRLILQLFFLGSEFYFLYEGSSTRQYNVPSFWAEFLAVRSKYDAWFHEFPDKEFKFWPFTRTCVRAIRVLRLSNGTKSWAFLNWKDYVSREYFSLVVIRPIQPDIKLA